MNKRLQSSSSAAAAADAHRRPATQTEDTNQNPLIPGLPDHLAPLCLRRVPPSLLFSVSSSWRRLLYSPLFPPFLSLYALFSRPSSAAAGHLITPVEFMTFDPIAGEWFAIPPPPPPPIRLILRHPSFISRDLPIQSLAVAGRLVLLSGTGDGLLPAFPLPLVFSPLSASWSYAPALKFPRRWCAAGTLGGSVYVASGIGSHFSSETARSFQKWNAVAAADRWEMLGELKDGRLSREAIDAVGCRGKLFMVNVKGSAAKQGAVYDAGEGEWEEMSEKMIGGWSGPAAAMAGEEIYVVDEAKGVLKVWDWEGKWVEVVGSPMLRGAKQIAAAGGRVCAVVVGAGGIVMVDVKAAPARVWVVETPPEYEAIAVHVLPRICR